MSKQKTEPAPVTFLAALPDVQAAIKIGNSGMRVMLDIPESEMAKAVPLLAMRDMVLRVTIVEDKQEQPPKADKPSAKNAKVVTGDFELKR